MYEISDVATMLKNVLLALYSINVLGLFMYASVIVLYKLWVYLYGVCFRTTKH